MRLLNTCHDCHKRIARLDDGYVELDPIGDRPPQVVHPTCGSFRGDYYAYDIGLGTLLGDGLVDWLRHMRRKNWWSAPAEVFLVEATWTACRIAARKRRPVPATLRAQILERDGFRCRRCGVTSREALLDVDHILPVALGGETIPNNLQTLCALCNFGKGVRLPTTYDLAVGRQ